MLFYGQRPEMTGIKPSALHAWQIIAVKKQATPPNPWGNDYQAEARQNSQASQIGQIGRQDSKEAIKVKSLQVDMMISSVFPQQPGADQKSTDAKKDVDA
jgi:hypothetical protein